MGRVDGDLGAISGVTSSISALYGWSQGWVPWWRCPIEPTGFFHERERSDDRVTGTVGPEPISIEPPRELPIRFRADDNDDLVAGVVRSVVADGEDGGDLFRRGINDEAIDTLRLFAMRRVLLGRRLSSLGPIYEALDACALIPGERDVPWDSWVKGALFIARGIGGDLDSMVQRFVDLHPERQARCDVVLESMDRVHELAQCRLAEVSTTYGVGLLETLAFLGRPTFGVWGAPRQADNYVSYAPTTNLAQLCVSLADALEASKKVTVGPIGQDQLGRRFSFLRPPRVLTAATRTRVPQFRGRPTWLVHR